jgi:hypothetical protein
MMKQSYIVNVHLNQGSGEGVNMAVVRTRLAREVAVSMLLLFFSK